MPCYARGEVPRSGHATAASMQHRFPQAVKCGRVLRLPQSNGARGYGRYRVVPGTRRSRPRWETCTKQGMMENGNVERF